MYLNCPVIHPYYNAKNLNGEDKYIFKWVIHKYYIYELVLVICHTSNTMCVINLSI